MPHSRSWAHYEELSEFERGRIVGTKEAGPQPGVMVRDAIYLDNWTSLVVIRGTLTAQWYVNHILRTVLLQFLLQYLGLVFQQDNARPHTARVIMNFLTASQTLSWPARSPDLFPVVHVWDIMGRRLHLPGNIDDLARQLEKVWQEIPQETVSVLYYSMPRRVAACIQAKGGSTPY
ncbi:transposable element Tc1 transposase [Trichonephila clavipes]|uniref:Transposable element Tc1 transposase n=1 Tax=Trichonephila clavipes TaxID=2585209 RepID=A0A8X6S7S8_TRICX|nr:transposable element Tc1 transposase [Trichonephila clavipes]